MAGNAAGARKREASRIGITVTEYDRHLLAGEKWCRACKAWHIRSKFGKDRSRTDGLCPTCLKSNVRTVNGPGKAERRAAALRNQAWCRHCAAWCPLPDVRCGKCRIHRNAEYRAYYAQDGETIRQRVYARKRQLDPIPGWWVREQRDVFGGLCAYGCGRRATSNDHVWPVSRGGRSQPGNIVPACTNCNSSKRDRDPSPWINRGFDAFPCQWTDICVLAAHHSCDDWLEALA